MNVNNNISPIPFYDSIEEQDSHRWWVNGKVYPLFIPCGEILPFQIVFPFESSLSCTNFKVYKDSGMLVGDFIDSLKAGGLRFVESSRGFSILVYEGKTPVFYPKLTEQGRYYAELTLSNGKKKYSEIWTAVGQLSGLIEINWYNRQNLDLDDSVIIYDGVDYVNRLLIATTIAKPEYVFTEDGDDRDGYFFPVSQISEKKYKFGFLASEYMLDVMRLIRLSDFVQIKDYNFNKIYKPDSFLLSEEWDDRGDVAEVTGEFETDTVAKKLNSEVSSYFRVMPSVLSFDYLGGNGTITVDSSQSFDFSKDASWMNVTRQGNVLYVSVVKSELNRQANISIKSGSSTQNISVFQKGLYSSNFISFTANAEQVVRLNNATPNLKFSYNGQQWEDWDLGDLTFGVPGKTTLYIGASADNTTIGTFEFDNDVEVVCDGNVQYLLSQNDMSSVPAHAFDSLFEDCTQLTKAPSLPNVPVGEYGYYKMFKGCISLEDAPIIGSSEIGEYGCSMMFEDCSALSYAPSIQRTTISKHCCEYMYRRSGVKSVSDIVVSGKIEDYGCAEMFSYCMNLQTSGRLVSAVIGDYAFLKMFSYSAIQYAGDGFIAGVLSRGCKEMFSHCEALKSCGSLKVGTISNYGLAEMFSECYELENTEIQIIGSGTTYLPDIIGSYGLEGMFENCKKLKKGIDIKGSGVSEYTCWKMYFGCEALTDTGKIVLKGDLEEDSMLSMFQGCVSLKTLDITGYSKIGKESMSGMFNGCVSLEDASPIIIDGFVDSSKDNCISMFEGCANLKYSPILSPLILVEGCYESMFKGCTSLQYSSILNAKTLATDCYKNMYRGCSSLHYVICNALNPNAAYSSGWMTGVSANGAFLPMTDTWNRGVDGIPSGWHIAVPVSFSASASQELRYTRPPSTKYKAASMLCYDGERWKVWDYTPIQFGTTGKETIMLAAYENNTEKSEYGKFSFGTNASVSGSGDLQTLLSLDEFNEVPESKFWGAFQCPQLVSAPTLNATIVKDYGYCNMFKGSGLVEPPTINATSLSQYACSSMFENCKSLTSSSIINATLGEGCLQNMFKGCTSLVTANNITSSNESMLSCEGMFEGCENLVNPPVLAISRTENFIFRNMFKGCKKLVRTPVLNADFITNFAYENMFAGCSSLVRVDVNATRKISDDVTQGWLSGVAATGDFYQKRAITFPTGSDGVPAGWTIHYID